VPSRSESESETLAMKEGAIATDEGIAYTLMLYSDDHDGDAKVNLENPHEFRKLAECHDDIGCSEGHDIFHGGLLARCLGVAKALPAFANRDPLKPGEKFKTLQYPKMKPEDAHFLTTGYNPDTNLCCMVVCARGVELLYVEKMLEHSMERFLAMYPGDVTTYPDSIEKDFKEQLRELMVHYNTKIFKSKANEEERHRAIEASKNKIAHALKTDQKRDVVLDKNVASSEKMVEHSKEFEENSKAIESYWWRQMMKWQCLCFLICLLVLGTGFLSLFEGGIL